MFIPKFECAEGQTIALVGPSGCGKSTFLNLIAGILNPSAGSIYIDTTEITSLSRAASAAFRLSEIGLIFQEFELVEHLSVGDNVLLPSYLGTRKDQTVRRLVAKDPLCSVGQFAAYAPKSHPGLSPHHGETLTYNVNLFFGNLRALVRAVEKYPGFYVPRVVTKP